jgi:integrase
MVPVVLPPPFHCPKRLKLGNAYLRGRLLHTITRDEIQAMGKVKAKEASRPTANPYLALVRAVLRRAAGPWQWIDKAPAVTLYPEAKRRVRWLSKEEVSRLLNALPPHQRQPARFALATGLRQANVLRLQWPDVATSSSRPCGDRRAVRSVGLHRKPRMVELVSESPDSPPTALP